MFGGARRVGGRERHVWQVLRGQIAMGRVSWRRGGRRRPEGCVFEDDRWAG